MNVTSETDIKCREVTPETLEWVRNLKPQKTADTGDSARLHLRGLRDLPLILFLERGR